MNDTATGTGGTVPGEALEALQQLRDDARYLKHYDVVYSEPHWTGADWTVAWHDGLDGRGVLKWDGTAWVRWTAIVDRQS